MQGLIEVDLVGDAEMADFTADLGALLEKAFKDIQASTTALLARYNMPNDFNISVKAEIAEDGPEGGYGASIGFWYSDEADWLRFRIASDDQSG